MAPKLTEQQIQDQNQIVETLENAGWKKTDKASIISLAELYYRNDSMIIEVEHSWRRSAIFLRLFSKVGDIFFVIEFEQKLKEFLEILIDSQDKISPINYKEYIRKVIRICPNSYLDIGDELVKLIDDKDYCETNY